VAGAANAKHSSESTDHYTPVAIVEAARAVLDVIELDPASCEIANQYIGARRIFTIADNGFAQRWTGRVFLNPPGGICDDQGRPVVRKRQGEPGCTISGSCGLAPGHEHKGVTSSAKAWWRKLATAWEAYDVECAVFVGFSIELLQSAQGLDVANGGRDSTPDPLDFPICVPRQRLEFLRETKRGLEPGAQPTHASVVVYLPPRWDHGGAKFREAFQKIGRVRT
jgi:hypothetical protein